MNLLGSLTDGVLAEHFDEITLQRAQAYAEEGCVSQPKITVLTRQRLLATAEVAGSGGNRYRTKLELEHGSDGLWLDTTCSCPVGINCKHGAAVALVIRQGFVRPDGGSAWQASLTALVEELSAQTEPTGDTTPLALELSVDKPGRGRFAGSPQPGVRLRPMRLGSKGNWVKSGVEWREVHTTAVTSAGRAYARDQLTAVRRLHRALQGHPYYSSTAYTHQPPRLDDFGDRVLDLLREARDAGVRLLVAGPYREVELLDEPLPVVAELRDTGTATAVTVGIEHDGGVRTGEQVLAIGSPAHTVAVLDGQRLLLGAPARPLPPTAQRLLGGDPVEVPRRQAAALGELLGPLSRLLPIRSPDGSVEVPEPEPPRLVVTVVWHDATKAELTWEWVYGQRRYALDSRDDVALVRDRPAELALLARVPEGLAGRTRADDNDALTLAVRDLPALRELDGVEVVELQRPDFREAADDPEIEFRVADGDAGSGGSPGTDWLDLTVSLTVEGEPVPLADVLGALTVGADHLVLPSGLYLTTDRPELERLRQVVEAAAQLRERQGDRLTVGTHDLGVWAELAELGVVDQQAAEWVHRAQALRDLREIPRPEPVGLETELRHYQQDGFAWLAFLWRHGLGGILADDMGLGKTLQVLALVAYAAAQGGTRRPFLVVAPTSVVTAWESEAARHTPGLRVATVRGKADDVAGLAADADLVVTTYTLLRLHADAYAGLEWAGLVLDEAHHVKNHQSKTYAAARRVSAPFRLAVTGTPFENRLMELWALLSLTTPGLYPWPRHFADQVVKPVEKEGDERALARFRQRIRPFILRRTKELVASDLPPKQEQVLPVELSHRHRRIYDAHLAKERQRILGLVDDFDRNRVTIFTALTRLRQLSLDPALVDEEHEGVGSAKIDLLVEHLQEITAEGHRALVFSQFTSYLGRVADRLAAEGIPSAYLDGRTRDRGGVISSFRDGDVPVFLISLKAGGVGLTLTEADYVFVLDPWWNPAAEAQAVDRAHRIGQERHVHVYRLISTDTIEEKVMELKERKAALFAQVVDGDGALNTAITADDIRGLFD